MKLPTEIKVNLWDILEAEDKKDEFWDIISNYLSNKYGYCHDGYSLDNEIMINIKDINWDEEEN